MRRRLSPQLPALLAAGAGLLLYRAFLLPERILAVRDLPFFHLPLRAALREAAGSGFPWWNPWIHGGQPILSNPNYAAFYPPTWLGLLLPLATSIQVVILLHAALAFAGAWRLTRRLGGEPAAAAFAALAFTGGGVMLSAPNTLNLFCAAAWIPWVLEAGDRLLTAGRHEATGQWLWLVAAGLALQLAAGEPVVVVTTSLGLLCLALSQPGRRLRGVSRLIGAGTGAALLGGVQLLPTLARVAQGAGGRLETLEGATAWSTHPYRLGEWLLPRLFGDPMLEGQGLYFGSQMHDNGFPYLIAVYLGILPLALGVAALARWPIPRRGAWLAMTVVGVALALGRYNPVYTHLLLPLPPFSLIRYPEKFLILAATAIPFAAGLGWQHLLEARRRGQPERADFPLALAALPALLAGLFLLVGRLRPDVEAWFVRHRSPVVPKGEALQDAIAYLTGEALIQLLLALGALALLAFHRWGRAKEERLVVAALLLLALDLGLYGRSLHPTAPADEFLQPPPGVSSMVAAESRLYVGPIVRHGAVELVLRPPAGSRLGPLPYTKLRRFDPYVANLWGIPYALHRDYDQMLTAWGRRGLDALQRETRAKTDRAGQLLRIQGAWNVGWLALSRSPEELAAADPGGPPPSPVRLLENPLLLPRWRTVRSVVTHGTWDKALRRAKKEGYPQNLREHQVEAAHAGEPIARRFAARVELGAAEEGLGRMVLPYRADRPAYLVAAFTFDRHWRAEVDGERVPIRPTALGQMGVELPAGDHRLVLTYRDPWVLAGASISALALIAGLWLVPSRRSA